MLGLTEGDRYPDTACSDKVRAKMKPDPQNTPRHALRRKTHCAPNWNAYATSVLHLRNQGDYAHRESGRLSLKGQNALWDVSPVGALICGEGCAEPPNAVSHHQRREARLGQNTEAPVIRKSVRLAGKQFPYGWNHHQVIR